MTNLEKALQCASRGWLVFPSYGRKPLVKWSMASSKDVDVITAWWTQWPEADVCIKTGAESNLVVVDWDSYKIESSLKQNPLGDRLPPTYTVRTERGGMHYYYTHPGYPVSNSAGTLAQYVDVRGDGGMVVVYNDVVCDTPPVRIPDSLCVKREVQTESVLPAEIVVWEGEGDGTDIGVDALERAFTLISECPPGQRNPTLFQEAADIFKLVAGGELAEESAMVALNTAGKICGLDPQEVHNTIMSARKRGFEEPYTPSRLSRIRNEDSSTHPTDDTYADAEWGSVTDTANALRLADRFEFDLRHSPSYGWLRYAGGRLVPVGGMPYDEGSNLSAIIRKEAVKAPTAEERMALEKWATQSAATMRIKMALEQASDFPGIRFYPSELDADPLELNTPSGVYSLVDGTQRIGSARDLITRITRTHPRPGAPVWDAFLKDVLPSTDMRNFIQRAVGYSITGLTREEVFFILYGEGQNGKSKFLEAIARSLGNYAHTFESKLIVATQHADHSTTTASLAGVRFAYTNEIDQGAHLDEGKVKSLTGGDAITARFMRRDEFTFRPSHKLWMATNHLPVIKGTDKGMWRRVLVLPFGVNISDERRDNLLSDKLSKESEGILAWCIDGATDYFKMGLCPPVEVLTATAAYKQSEDTVTQFLADIVIFREGGTVFFTDLYARFQAWCLDNGTKPFSALALAKELNRIGIEGGVTTGNKKIRRGIQFLEGVRV